MTSFRRVLAGILLVVVLPQCILAEGRSKQKLDGAASSRSAWAPIASFAADDAELATEPQPAPGHLDAATFSSFKTKSSKDTIKEDVLDKVEQAKKKIKGSIHIHKGKKKEHKESDEAYITKLVGQVKHIQEGFDAHNISERFLASRLESAMMQTHAAKAAEAAADGDAKPVCPPPGFNTQEPIDIVSFISDPWYVQEQYPTAYNPSIANFCVAQAYKPLNDSDLFEGLRVLNYANVGKVNGFPIGVSGVGGPIGGIANNIFFLKATIPNKTELSKIVTGPYFTGPIASLTLPLLGLPLYPQVFQGGLWVVRAGPGVAGEPGFKGYEWAVMTGGLPTVPSGDACRSGNALPTTLQINDVGYWLFTRAKVAPPETVAEMRALGASLGLDNSLLEKVKQEGCNYEYFV